MEFRLIEQEMYDKAHQESFIASADEPSTHQVLLAATPTVNDIPILKNVISANIISNPEVVMQGKIAFLKKRNMIQSREVIKTNEINIEAPETNNVIRS